MILHTVFKVFVNLKIGCDTKSRQQKKKGRSNAGSHTGLGSSQQS